MCTNTISSYTDHFRILKRHSEESLLTFENRFPSLKLLPRRYIYKKIHYLTTLVLDVKVT